MLNMVVIKVIVGDIVELLINRVNGVTQNPTTQTTFTAVKLMRTVNVPSNSVGEIAAYNFCPYYVWRNK